MTSASCLRGVPTPRADTTASCPLTEAATASASATLPNRVETVAGAFRNLSGFRTKAVTWNPRAAACRTTSCPVRPDAPNTRRRMCAPAPRLTQHFAEPFVVGLTPRHPCHADELTARGIG